VTQRLDLQVLKVQQAQVVTKGQLHLQDLRVLKDQKEIKVSKDQLETHHKDQKVLKVVHHKDLQEVPDLVGQVVVVEILHKDLQDQQDLVVVEVIRVVLDLQEPRVLRDQQHLQDLRDLLGVAETVVL